MMPLSGAMLILVAPIKVGKNAYVAAGSTITEDVEENALVIARKSCCHKAQLEQRSINNKFNI